MQDIKAGAIDEDGLGINNVEIALARVDIKLRDSKEEFRDMGGVLEELSGKWETLSETEQKNISKSIAGVRQANVFSVLMQNMNKALELQEAQLNATGLATDRYGFYLESVEGSQNKAKASMEALFLSMGKFDGAVITFYKLSASVLDAITALGGLPQVLNAVTFALLAYNSATIVASLRSSTFLITIGELILGIRGMVSGLSFYDAAIVLSTMVTDGLTASLLANPAGWVLLGIGALAGSLIWLAGAEERATKKTQELNQALEDTVSKLSSLNDDKGKIQDLWQKYDKLLSKIKELGTVSSLTADEQKEWYDVQSQLAKLVPDLNYIYDEQGRILVDQKTTLAELIALKKEEIILAKEAMVLAAEERVQDLINTRQGKLDAIDAQKQRVTNAKAGGDPEHIRKQERELKLLENSLRLDDVALKRDFKNIGSEMRDALIEGFKTGGNIFGDKSQNDLDILEMFGFGKSNLYHRGTGTKTSSPTTSSDKDKTYKEYSSSILSLSNNFEKLSSAIPNSTEAFTALDEILKVSEKELSDYLNNDGTINIGKLRQETDLAIESILGFSDASSNMADNEKNALRSTAEAAREATTEVVAFGYSISQLAFNKVAESQADAIWKLVEEAGQASIVLNDRTLYGGQQVFDFMKQYPQRLAELFTAMTAQGIAGTMNMAQTYVNAIASVVNAVKMPDISSMFGTPSGGGGGGGSEKSKEEIRLEKQIKGLEDKKKALKDVLDEFNKYIDAQKESLKIQKAEAAFSDSLLKKNKSLAKLKSDIAILSLDNSQEAIAQRLKLEEDASNLQTEITKDSEDRKYDLQIEALDKAKQDFEDNINNQIKGIDNTITKYQEQTKAIQESTKASGGASSAVQSLGQFTLDAGAKIMDVYSKTLNLSERNRISLQKEIDKWVEKKVSIEEASIAVWDFAQRMLIAQSVWNAMPDSNMLDMRGRGYTPEKKHSGGFIGGLSSNEEFAKLLKGEYVATEGQMSNFMKSVLPSMMSKASITNSNKNGNISISMPINVSGSLDKSVLPDIKRIADNVIKEINKSMGERGFTRRADAFSI